MIKNNCLFPLAGITGEGTVVGELAGDEGIMVVLAGADEDGRMRVVDVRMMMELAGMVVIGTLAGAVEDGGMAVIDELAGDGGVVVIDAPAMVFSG